MTASPIKNRGVDGSLKQVNGYQPLVGEEGGLELGVDRKAQVIAILL
jgi:hypothetical protein